MQKNASNVAATLMGQCCVASDRYHYVSVKQFVQKRGREAGFNNFFGITQFEHDHHHL